MNVKHRLHILPGVSVHLTAVYPGILFVYVANLQRPGPLTTVPDADSLVVGDDVSAKGQNRLRVSVQPHNLQTTIKAGINKYVHFLKITLSILVIT